MVETVRNGPVCWHRRFRTNAAFIGQGDAAEILLAHARRFSSALRSAFAAACIKRIRPRECESTGYPRAGAAGCARALGPLNGSDPAVCKERRRAGRNVRHEPLRPDT